MPSTPPHVRSSFRGFSNLMAVAATLAFALIILGAAVRATKAGLACPDWPLCYGQAVPVFDLPIFLEWSHRVLAALLVVLVAVAGVPMARDAHLRQAFAVQVGAVLALLLAEVALGGLTVLKSLAPLAVAAHLVNALLVLTVLLWATVRATVLGRPLDNLRPLRPVPPSVGHGLAAACGLAFAEIALGGLISGHDLGMACPDFPTCHGRWVPPFSLPPMLQMLHRGTAFLLLAGVLALAVGCSRWTLPPATRLSLRLAPTLVVLAGLIGVAAVYLGLPPWVSVAHLTLAVAIYALLLVGAATLSHSPMPAGRALTLPMRGDWRMKDQLV